MVRIKLDNLSAELVSRFLLEHRDRAESATVRAAIREAAVQALEQITDKRVGTLYVHLDSPDKPWMLMDLKFDNAGRPVGVFKRKDEDDYESENLADWRTF